MTQEDNTQMYMSMLKTEQVVMKLYATQFGDTHDQTYGIFSQEQQIERYAQILAFWRRLSKGFKQNDINDIYKLIGNPRYIYIKERRGIQNEGI